MVSHSATPLLFREGDRGRLTRLVHSTSMRARIALPTLERTSPRLPAQPGRLAARTYD